MKRVERDAVILVFSTRIVVSQLIKRGVGLLARIAGRIEPVQNDKLMEAIAWKTAENDGGKRIDEDEWEERRGDGGLQLPAEMQVNTAPVNSEELSMDQLFSAFAMLRARGFEGDFKDARAQLGLGDGVLDPFAVNILTKYWEDSQNAS